MGRVYALQNNFTVGMLDPLMLARVDIDQYYGGCKDLTNVVCLPHGAVRRRPGSRYIAVVPGSVSLGCRLAAFEFNEAQTYVLLFTDTKIEIYDNGVLDFTLSAGDGVPWTEAELARINWTQSADTMIVVHPDHAPRRILRTGATWAIDVLPLKNVPKFNFADGSSPPGANEVQQLTPAGAMVWGKFALGEFTTELIITNPTTQTAAQVAARIEAALRKLGNTSDTGITVISVGTEQNRVYEVTFGGDDGDLDWEQIVAFTPTGGSWGTTETMTEGTPPVEETWSAGRGWPTSVTFHAGRLVFGGSKSRPNVWWGSKSGDFFNFDVGEGLDDEAIERPMVTDQLNAIINVYSARHLQIFTTGAEFYVPARVPTPEDSAPIRQTSYGSAPVRPIFVDGATLFVQENKRAVRDFLFGFAEEAYSSSETSLLFQSFVADPVDMAVQLNRFGDYGYVVTEAGIIAVLNTNREQGIKGWTRFNTAGTYEHVAVADDIVHVVVKRTINGTAVRWLEKFDEAAFLDAGVTLTGSQLTTWTGLSRLDGETVNLVLDGVPQGTAVVTGGQVTTPVAGDSLEVGLLFTPRIETLPVDVGLANGRIRQHTRKVTQATLNLLNSAGVFVNGYRAKQRAIGQAAFTLPTPPITGIVDVRLRGYGREPTVVITQTEPLPMTILALEQEVRISY